MKKIFSPVFFFLLLSCNNNHVPQIVLTPLESGIHATIRAIDAVNDSVVWASGAGGHVLKSGDCGENWEVFRIDTAGKMDFRSLYAWGADSAMVFSTDNPAVAYKTSDGGKTWRMVFKREQKGIFINSMSFKDAGNGVAVGDPVEGKFLLLGTTDGGETWNDLAAPVAGAGEGGFAASNSCVQYLPSGKIVFITGVAGANFYSAPGKDRGWKVAEPGIRSGGEDGCDGIYCVYMKDDKTGMVAGGNYKQEKIKEGVVAFTADGGATWHLPQTPPHGFISCVRPVPGYEKMWIAVGSHGYSVSYDDGRNWVPGSEEGYHALTAPEKGKYMYAAGERGKMARIEVQ